MSISWNKGRHNYWVQHVACSRKRRETFRVLVIKPEGEIPEDRCGWDDTIKMNPQEIAWEVVDWIHLAQDGTCGELLCTWYCIFELHKMLEISWLAEKLSDLFYIYCSVHHNILWNNQQMQLYAVNFIPLLSSLCMFQAPHTPIIRSTMFNCIYSHWYKP